MQRRRLGTQGLKVSAIGLGCMGMSDFYAPRDEAESVATLHRALDLGIDFFDTSDAYGPYTNEELVGRKLKPHRDKTIIATKFGIMRKPEGTRGINGTPEYVRASCDASLKRLETDTIDLCDQHRVDPKTPLEETVGAMGALVRAGKIRYLKPSEAGAQTIRRAHAVHPISALQTEYYSLWSREAEDEILLTVREQRIGFVAYSPLARGLLTGQMRKPSDLAPDDWRHSSPRFRERTFRRTWIWS
jgi:aryl-alcohol dehydrogenase-like predicted oxidoreductase